MYAASVVPVLIASPGDVTAERSIIRECVYDWNYTDSVRNSLVLLPVGWETHSSPEIGIEPQEQINNRIVDKCDLLVGVFWTRLGTPTSASGSGTLEEIERFLQAEKPVLIYFSNTPVVPGSVDTDQLNAVRSFQDRVKRERLGLYETFSDKDELLKKFSRQLRITLQDNAFIQQAVEELRSVDQAIEESGLETVSLPKEAVELLLAAAEDKGIISVRSYLGGTSYSAGSVKYETNGSGRVDANIRDGVHRLDQYGLIEERSFGSGLYFLTREGYEAVERHNSN